MCDLQEAPAMCVTCHLGMHKCSKSVQKKKKRKKKKKSELEMLWHSIHIKSFD